MRRRLRALALAASAAVLMAAPAIAFATTPPQNGCPAAAEQVLVSSFDAAVYGLPGRLDAGGNNDGYICAFALPDQAFGPGYDFTIYQFFENNLTPSH